MKRASSKIKVTLFLLILLILLINRVNLGVDATNISSENDNISGKILAIGVDEVPSWRDFLALASFPVQSKLNSSTSLCVSLFFPVNSPEPTESQSEFISQFNPIIIYAIGLSGLEKLYENVNIVTNPSNEVIGSCEIASYFWTNSEIAIVTKSVPVNEEECYRNALIASSLASSLEAPLLFVNGSEIPEFMKNTLERLHVRTIFIIGNISQSVLTYFSQMDISIKRVESAVDAARIILESKKDAEYLVVTNPSDRNSLYVKKLSLLAPSLSAGREGILYPLSDTPLSSQKRFYVSVLSSEEPEGVPSSATFKVKGGTINYASPNSWVVTEVSPRLQDNLSVHPVNGAYLHANAPWAFPGGAWIYILDGYHIMYLAASKANQTGFDILLFDKQHWWSWCGIPEEGSGIFSNDEVFKEGDLIPMRQDCPNWICYLKVEKIDPNGTLVLRYQFWKKGHISIDNADYEFVLTCSDPGAFGTYNAMNIDFNADGRFDGEDEGPYTTGDSIHISGKIFDVIIDPFGMYVDLVSPSRKEIRSQITGFCQRISFLPKYLAIVGFPDSIPYTIARDPKITFLPPHELEDFIPTDVEYGRIENQEFPSALTGRIFAENIIEASSLIARTLSYDLLKHTNIEWSREALIISVSGAFYDSLQASMFFHLVNNFRNVNYRVKSFLELPENGLTFSLPYLPETLQDFRPEDLRDKSIICIHAHGTPYYIDLCTFRLEANTNWTLRTPALLILDSCNIGMFPDNVDVNSYLLNVLFRRGAVAVLAQTYLSWCMGTPLLYNAFLNALLYQNSSLGEALMCAQEYAHIRAYSEPEDLRQLLEREQAYLSTTLYGDPSLRIGSSIPQIEPARQIVNGVRLTITAPGVLWDLIKRKEGYTEWDSSGAIERSGPGLILESDKNRNAFLCYVEGNFTKIRDAKGNILNKLFHRKVGAKIRVIWLITDLPIFCPPNWFESGWKGEWSADIGGTLPRNYYFDDLPPKTTDNYDGLWHNSDFTIILTAVDDRSGVAETYYRINNGPIKAVSTEGQPSIITEGANNTLEYWSVDLAGNEELPHKVLTGIKLDKTAPVIEEMKLQPEGDVEPNQPVKILVNAIDSLSGIKNVIVSYTIGDAPSWTDIPMTFNASSGFYEGTIQLQQANTIIKYRVTAYDNAGNHVIEDNNGQYYAYRIIPEYPPVTIILTLLIILIVTTLTVLWKRKSPLHKYN